MTVGRIPSIEGGIQPTLLTTAGDTLYASSASNPVRLAIGTAGQVLQVNSGATAPEWATASSGGMTLISTTSLSGASVVLSSIPATYNNLQLVIRDILPSTDGAELRLRLNGDSNANRYVANSWNAANASVSFSQDSIQDVAMDVDNAVTQNLQIIDLYDYTNTVTWKYGTSQSISVNTTTNTNVALFRRLFAYNQTAAISSITIYFNSGNITSGTALLYGVK